MKKGIVTTALAVIALGAAGFAATRAFQDGFTPAQPTDQHAWLASHVGTWDAKVMQMGQESTGTWKVEKGPGDLWIVSHFEGQMMGMPFTGLELMGYDPQKKEFVSVWADSMTATPQTMRGTYDAAAKKLVMKGEGPGMDGQPATMTNVSQYADADTIHFTMSMPGPDGADMEVMSIDYKRRK